MSQNKNNNEEEINDNFNSVLGSFFEFFNDLKIVSFII